MTPEEIDAAYARVVSAMLLERLKHYGRYQLSHLTIVSIEMRVASVFAELVSVGILPSVPMFALNIDWESGRVEITTTEKVRISIARCDRPGPAAGKEAWGRCRLPGDHDGDCSFY